MVCAAGSTPPRMKTYFFPQQGAAFTWQILAAPTIARRSLLHALPKPFALRTAISSATNRLCLLRKGRGDARVAQQISCRDLFTFPFPSCIILDLRRLPRRIAFGRGMAMAVGLLSPVNTNPRAFSDFSSSGLF